MRTFRSLSAVDGYGDNALIEYSLADGLSCATSIERIGITPTEVKPHLQVNYSVLNAVTGCTDAALRAGINAAIIPIRTSTIETPANTNGLRVPVL